MPERATREVWAKRVERWLDSGLRASEFAAEIGVNPRTLTYWKWRLGRCKKTSSKEVTPAGGRRPRRSRKGATAAIVPAPLSFVEMSPPRGSAERTMEVELVSGERIRLKDDFDAAALRRVLDVLEVRR